MELIRQYATWVMALGCVLVLIWGIETWLSRLVEAINGVTRALGAQTRQRGEFVRQALEAERQRDESRRFAELRAETLESVSRQTLPPRAPR